MGYLYIFGTVFFTVYGQLILKWRIVEYGALPERFSEKLIFLFKLLFDPYIFSGFFAAFIASFLWMAAMTKFDVSHAYPIIVGGLAILTSVFAVIFLKESFSILKIVGLLLIVSGVFFLSKGS
ncbi:MAG: EamA family transporter [Ghiorsea sp.]|nr:EamA family transporter [Ghiorsea sp.]